jgi:citrate synthase
MVVIYKGLQDVVVAESKICFIDGKLGRLVYRGYSITDIVTQSNFEEIAYLVWHGSLPNKNQFNEFLTNFKESVEFPDYLQKFLLTVPRYANAMDVLRSAISYASHFDSTIHDSSPHSLIKKSYRITNLFNSIIPNWYRVKRGEEYILPDKNLTFSHNFLYQLFGKKEIPQEHIKALDVALILHIDHGFNASTFSARVTSSTLSDIYSAVVSAIGTLKGPLHGGANEQVMKMLTEIGEPSNAEKYLRNAFDKKQKIPGFGHRVYKTYDPRAMILKEFATKLGANHPDKKYLDIIDILVKIMTTEKNLYPNVDLYSGLVYHYIGIKQELFTPIFALARIVGWTAHIMEQLADNKIIRPLEDYVGPQDLKYIPIEKR